MTDQPDMQQSDHPEHRMPPSENYTHDNSVIFDVPDTANAEGANRGQGPTQAAANAANVKPYARRRGRPAIGNGSE